MIKHLLSALALSFFAILFISSSNEKHIANPVWDTPVDIQQSKDMGFVYVRYEYSIYENPNIDWKLAHQTVLNKCKAWGYPGMLFDKQGERECMKKDKKGNCVRWRVIHRCECVDDTLDVNFAKNVTKFNLGSGVAVADGGYVATSFFVADSAKSFRVKGINGSFVRSYEAQLEFADEENDIAILKITDEDFDGFGSEIPYQFATDLQKVGTEVFALGYPGFKSFSRDMRMNEGVVNAQTGANGEVRLYQTSLPFQAHFSGGPVFNSKGELVGLTSTQFTFYERYCHATKSSYLKTLADLLPQVKRSSKTPDLSSMTRSEQVEALRNFTFMIERVY
ncbi:YecR family lipoprotein [Halocola ammonii]